MPVGQKRAAGSGRADALERGDAAQLFGREELEAGVAEIEPAHDLARRGDAGDERDRRLARRFHQLRRAAGRERVARAGVDRGVEIGHVQHRAGADDHLRRFAGDRADGVERGRRAQRDLDRADAACEQHARQRHGLRRVIDGDDRDDRRKRQHAGGVLRRLHAPSVIRLAATRKRYVPRARAPELSAPSRAGVMSLRFQSSGLNGRRVIACVG